MEVKGIFQVKEMKQVPINGLQILVQALVSKKMVVQGIFLLDVEERWQIVASLTYLTVEA